ncbi:MAG: 5'-deoxynucleotidase [Bacillota bacterium]
MNSHFFAYLSRMKLIKRWSLMRNVLPENIQEHSLQVAMIAHALAVISNKYFAGDVDPQEVAVLAIYHDAGEVVIGDLPTPVKYYNPEINIAYKEIEKVAKDKLLSLLPAELRPDFAPLFSPSPGKAADLVKAADKISAYAKCLEETAAGNGEFAQAEKTIKKELDKYAKMPEVEYFVDKFIPSFKLTIDEMD